MTPSTAAQSASRLSGLSAQEVRHYLGAYSNSIAAKSSLGGKGQGKGETLESLDAWYQSLAHCESDAGAGKPPIISCKGDLVRLMRWKLAREKFRPTLMSLIQSNADTVVQDVLSRGYASLALLPPSTRGVDQCTVEIVRAMKILAELRGVGPATASAIVALYHPLGIFQSDELATLLLPQTSIKYDWKFYSNFYPIALQTMRDVSAKTQDVRCGKTLETLAWSIVHSSSEASDQGEDHKFSSTHDCVSAKLDAAQSQNTVTTKSTASATQIGKRATSPRPTGTTRRSKRLKSDTETHPS